MTTGYSAAGGCWTTVNEAIDAYYSSQQSQFAVNANAIFRSQHVKDAGVWKLQTYSTANAANWGTPTYAVAPTNIYGTCTLETSPGYPQQLTTTGGGSTGGSGTVTGTVTIAQPVYEYSSATAVAAWSIAFTTVLGMWWMAKNFGIVINAIRRW